MATSPPRGRVHCPVFPSLSQSKHLFYTETTTSSFSLSSPSFRSTLKKKYLRGEISRTMVILRNRSHYELRPSQPTPGPTERLREKARLQERRRSPRRRSSTTTSTGTATKTTVVREATRDRVPTPLAEKKNEENTRPNNNNHPDTRDLATRPKTQGAGAAAEASPTRAPSSPTPHNNNGYDASRPRTRRRASGKEKSIKGKGPKGARNLGERNWSENVSPPLKARDPDDDVPMIIECWQ